MQSLKKYNILYMILLLIIMAANMFFTYICHRVEDEYSFVMSFWVSGIVTLVSLFFIILFFISKTATYGIGIITSLVFIVFNFTSTYKEMFGFKLNVNDEVYELEHGVSRIDDITRGFYVQKALFVLIIVKLIYSIIMLKLERENK